MIALMGFGNAGRAFARLLETKRSTYPFQIVAIHTATHGTAYSEKRLTPEAEFGPPAASVEECFNKAEPDVVIELTTVRAETGEPAITHIRQAFARGAHVVTGNRGPVAVAWWSLCDDARRVGVEFRFDSTCMDGAPVSNMVWNNLPGVEILGFTGVLNSTGSVAIDAMRRGLTMEQGTAEAAAPYDIEGWDSAKTAALANVLRNARVTPRDVNRKGIEDLTPAALRDLASGRRTVCLASRANRTGEGIDLRGHPEILSETDLLATVRGTSNLLLFHTGLMRTAGTVSISPGAGQTAYGVFSDVTDIASSL